MILPHKKYKIALIGYRLSGGGSDKVMANLSLFFESKGIEIHNIIVLDEVSYPYAGKLVNLGLLKNKSNGFFNKIKRLFALRNYLNSNHFDYIIDFRFRTKIVQEMLLSRLIYNTKTIFTVHSFLINHYMPNNSWLTQLMYNRCFANVVLTSQMYDEVLAKHDLNNVVTIANPVNSDEIVVKSDEPIAVDYEYIIAIGQYENSIKQFDKLIESYSKSTLPSKNIHLVILGNGNKSILNKVIKECKIADFVHLEGYQENPYKFLKRSKFLVLCSKNEGMPNVILEAFACGVPVVSFDCASGPKEMISNKINGLLIEDQNFEQLIIAMNSMIANDDLHLKCKLNSNASVTPYLLKNIGEQWLDLLQIPKI